MTGTYNRIVIIDLVAESNAGDRALHEGLIQLVRQIRPAARISVTGVVGPNQLGRLITDLPSIAADPSIEVLPALRPTFFSDRARSRIIAEAGNALGLVLGWLWLGVARVAPRFSRQVLPRKARNSFDAIADAEVVLWKGKNLRGRSNRPLEFFRIASRVFMPRVCQALGTPLIAVGLSVWPIHGRLTRRLVRSTLAACIHVTARESSSRAEIEDLLAGRGPAVKQVPDLALAWLSQQEPDQNNSVPDAGALGVAVTLVDWSEFGRATRQDYVFSIAGYLDWLQTRYDLTVRIVPQVTKEWESADAITSDLIGAVSGKTRPAIQVVPPVSDPGDLVAIYRTADLLIATRMHSAIFALAVGTPVIAIPYDIGAKWQILGDLGIGDFLIPYPEITAEGLITRHRRLVTDGSAILDRVRANLEEQYTHLADNLGPLAR